MPLPTHVALLRGINVGKAKRVAMADLRQLVAGLGYGDVRTLLNSGNVVFSAPGVKAEDAARRIETAVASKLGVLSRVVVLTGREIASIVDGNPFGGIATNHSRLFVPVPAGRAGVARLKPLLKSDWGPERLAIGSRAAYIWCPDGITDSELFAAVARTLGDGVTTRNWATMLKIEALLRDGHAP